MGFLDYALSISLQEDKTKARIHLNTKLRQPTLTWNENGADISLPIPTLSEEGSACFLTYEFPQETGKEKVARLFRASIFHLTAHTRVPIDDESIRSAQPKSILRTFSESLASDVLISAYMSAQHPDKLADLAYANSLSFHQLRPVERISNPATRIMTALLSKMNTGLVKGELHPEEQQAVSGLTTKLEVLRESATTRRGEDKMDLQETFDNTVTEIVRVVEPHGPILESPSMPYTEQTGPCTVFSNTKLPHEIDIERVFTRSIETFGGSKLSHGSMDAHWKKETRAEASQVFDSEVNQKARERKILTRIEKFTEGSRFKSVGFPEEDYTHYLRARMFLKGGSRRLLDSLRAAQDALDEDPGKEMGQLDLTAVVQKIASQSPRTDVFMQNEYLSRSFAWGILFDVSASMKAKAQLGRALAICVAEATKELLMDPGSWTFLAFSDRLYILKDASEAYSRRVRARIGGLKFEGLTYMPDAIRIAGEIVAHRFDEQRFLVVLSDGWPYGYPNVSQAVRETVRTLEKRGVIVIGVGLETERMKDFFKISCNVHSQKDLIKKFARIYIDASAAALER